MRSAWRDYRPTSGRARRRFPPRSCAHVIGNFGAHPRTRSRQFAHRLRHHRLQRGQLRIVAQGCIATAGGPLADRLRTIHARVAELIAQHAPQEIAVERVFLSKNADSALKLGQARGAALAAVPLSLSVHEYAPRAIKLAVVGVGGAEKLQVAHMVKQLLRVDMRLGAGRGRCVGRGHLPRQFRAPYRTPGRDDGVIGFIRGKLVVKTPPHLTVDVGGVGYDIEAPMSTFYTLPALGSEVRLLTHLVVREDAHILYGFGTQEERTLFRNLLKVSQIGPKIALSILSGVSVEGFATLVKLQDSAALTRIPGVGRKTAERVLMEMKDRLDALNEATVSGAVPMTPASTEGEAWTALVALGYKPAEVTAMLKPLAGSGGSTEDLIRRALQGAAR
jgi:Holliday junction DNA helicase RuvA